MRSAHCTSRRMLLSKATARFQPISFLFTDRSAADGSTWSLPRSQWHKMVGDNEPNHPTAYFAWRAVSVPDRFGGPDWFAVSGHTVAPGCGGIGGWRKTKPFCRYLLGYAGLAGGRYDLVLHRTARENTYLSRIP